MKNVILAAVTITVLAGCSTPSMRGEHEDAFKFRAAGQIDTGKLPQFMDCVLDTFVEEQRRVNALVYQWKRSTGYRIDLKTDKFLLLSADIYDDGRTQLLEGPAAGMLPTGAEIERYERCVASHGRALPESPIKAK